jgi:hypothetical protein
MLAAMSPWNAAWVALIAVLAGPPSPPAIPLPKPASSPQPSPSLEPVQEPRKPERPPHTCEGIKRVPQGVIRGGCDASRGANCLNKSVPAFEIDCGLVLRASYQACVTQGACKAVPKLAETPLLVGATPAQASRYCQWRMMRLPTESQWERAREMEVLYGLDDSLSEWLDGWYDWTPKITEEMREEGYYNSRLLLTMNKGHSFRYGGDPNRGFPFVGFRCARGGSSQPPKPPSPPRRAP